MFTKIIIQRADFPVICTRELLMSMMFSGESVGLFNGTDYDYGQIEQIALNDQHFPPQSAKEFIVKLWGSSQGYMIKTA